jgi:heat shock 70kDa protein 4
LCALFIQEAAKAAAEKGDGDGEDDEDHDTRRLKKADRMRMVVKNKEEGTELFKAKNFRLAAARYHKALTHAAKFFDLSAEDEGEVRALKVTLYVNLAVCYTKLDNWESMLRNCNDALALDPNNVKALFRRASYYEKKKEWTKAMDDLKKCVKINAATPGTAEDKAVAGAIESVKKGMAAEKSKEKSTWGKMFS